MTIARWRDDDGAIAMARCSIASSPSHHRAFAIASSHHRLVGRWCDGVMTMTQWRDDDDAMTMTR